jgi:uncharacterized membrane protein
MECFVFTQFIFWPWFAGLTFLIAGLVAVRRELAASVKLDKLIVLGPVFFAVPLAVFGAEHLAGAQFVMQVVPHWIPARLFWTYFVGFALIAAAVSILLKKHVRRSAMLLGAMFFLFVLFIHGPNVAVNPRDRIAWAVAFRDLAFGWGALALAATQNNERRIHGPKLVVARLSIAMIVIFFAVEHFLHPEFVPVVPLNKLTPAWMPFRLFLGYFTGAVMLATGAAMLINRQARTAAIGLGAAIILLVVFIYLPILARAAQPQEIMEALNYVADTLFFGGTVLVLAGSMPRPV